MSSITLQFHITNRCNKRCSHCYQNNYSCEEFTTEELKNIIKQYRELLKKYNKEKNVNERGHINITGGEPFVREDIWEILDYIKKYKNEFTFGILTNGSFLIEEVVKRLKTYNPRIIQVSLDGNKEMHNKIRGEGSYEEVIQAIKLLKKYKIKCLVSFTANNKNYKLFPEVVSISRRAGAYKVWTDRMVPIGSGLCKNEVSTLTPEEVVDYVNIIKRTKNSFINKYSKIIVSSERSLQFLSGEDASYICTAGDGLIIVQEDGDVLPCRRLPLVAGNIRKDSLINIYYNSPIMKKIRCFKERPKGCEKCNFYGICKGGAKCISYGIYGDYTYGDYGCILKEKK